MTSLKNWLEALAAIAYVLSWTWFCWKVYVRNFPEMYEFIVYSHTGRQPGIGFFLMIWMGVVAIGLDFISRIGPGVLPVVR